MSKLEDALKNFVEEILREHSLIEGGSDDDEDEDERPAKKGKDAKPAKKEKKGGKKVTLESVQDKLTELVNEKGKAAAVKLLKTFGVSKASDLDEDDYTKFLTAADKLIGPADDEDENDDDDDDEDDDD